MGRGVDSSKSRAGTGGDPKHQRQPPRYGTFQDASSSCSQPPAIGFPQHNPPSPSIPRPSSTPCYYTYEALPVAEGKPVPRLPCCGIGIGWFLFITGFFLATIPWFVGACILMCGRVDYREKTGYAACTVAAIIAVITIFVGVSAAFHYW